MLFFEPAQMRWILGKFGILAEGLPLALQATASRHWPVVALIPLATILVGIWMALLQPSIERIVAGMAAGTIAITLMINLLIQPALAETLSPKQFAKQASERAGSQTIYSFGSLDYGFVFYSGRDVKFASVTNPPALIVGCEEEWPLMPAHFRAHYRVVLRSNPTDVDGTGRLLLLSRTDRSS